MSRNPGTKKFGKVKSGRLKIWKIKMERTKSGKEVNISKCFFSSLCL